MMCGVRFQIVVSEDGLPVPALRPDWTEGGTKIVTIRDTLTVFATHNGKTCDITDDR